MPRRYRFTHVKNGERKKQAISRAESSTSSTNTHQLHALLKKVVLDIGWVDITNFGAATIHLCKGAGIARHSYDLIIREDCTWTLYIHGYEVSHEFIDAPNLLVNVEQIQMLVQKVGKTKVCAGNPDERFVEMMSHHENQIKSANSQLVAHVIEGYPVHCDGIEYNCTVRTATCTVLTDGSTRCTSCKKFRAQLRAMYSRYNKKLESTK